MNAAVFQRLNCLIAASLASKSAAEPQIIQLIPQNVKPPTAQRLEKRSPTYLSVIEKREPITNLTGCVLVSGKVVAESQRASE